MTDTRRLYLLRHAQAHPSGPSDHQRPLDPQGEADARALGAILAQRSLPPFCVVASDSARTRGTWTLLEAAGLRAEARFEPALFHGGEDVYRAAAAGNGDCMIVGHNPVIGALARQLARTGEKLACETLARGFPTCALAVLRFEGATLAEGHLEELLIPPHRPR